MAATGVIIGLVRATWFYPRHGVTDDYRAFELTAQLTLDGVNVYAASDLYRYGPGWQAMLWVLGQFTPPDSTIFRMAVVGLLTATDVVIAWCLGRLVGRRVCWLFLLNPLSMIISGFHLQFDNIALAIGLAAIVATRRGAASSWLTHPITIGLVGLSLVVKHLLFVLPIWILMRANTARQRVSSLVPFAIFGGSFVPWALTSDGRRGIVEDVLLFRSGREVPLLGILGESVEELNRGISVAYGSLALLTLIGLGWFTRRESATRWFFLYVLAAFALSPGLSNQQLVALLLALLGLRSVAAIPVMLYGWLFLTIHPDGLHATSDPKSWLSASALSGLFDAMIALEYSPFIVTALVVLVVELRRGSAAAAVRGA
ncbi:MAG: hypothetical protein ACKORC_01385 [Acidimicrobiia bacterium]